MSAFKLYLTLEVSWKFDADAVLQFFLFSRSSTFGLVSLRDYDLHLQAFANSVSIRPQHHRVEGIPQETCYLPNSELSTPHRRVLQRNAIAQH